RALESGQQLVARDQISIAERLRRYVGTDHVETVEDRGVPAPPRGAWLGTVSMMGSGKAESLAMVRCLLWRRSGPGLAQVVVVDPSVHHPVRDDHKPPP